MTSLQHFIAGSLCFQMFALLFFLLYLDPKTIYKLNVDKLFNVKTLVVVVPVILKMQRSMNYC